MRTPGTAAHLFLLAAFLPAGSLAAQAPSANEVTLFAESFAGGVQYLRHLGGPWRLGVQVGAGPTEGVTVSEEPGDNARTWATGYPTVGFRSPGGVELLLSPIGVAVISGSDFATVYPSGQLQLGLASGRFRVGSVLRVVRIAGGYGSGTYWTQWVPLRLGIALGR